MKLSIKWLRSWVKTTATPQALGDALTAGGLELESITPMADDEWLELGITPNRGDCLSVKGIAREAAALLGAPFMSLSISPVPATIPDTCHVIIEDPVACPAYAGRRILNVNAAAPTPDWLLQRLQSAGVKPVSVIVDIGNYVMMELGQPMHAFDTSKISGNIRIRKSAGESVVLIDNSTVTLDHNTCVIVDDKHILALGGVMGALDSSVTATTTDIFLESAFFAPQAVRGRARYYRVTSEGNTRFERGVDPTLFPIALERATALILAHAGGEAGPVCLVEAGDLPVSPLIILPHDLVAARLGIHADINTLAALLAQLGMECKVKGDVLHVVPPAFRFDVQIPEDLLEEIARMYGYDRIPESLPPMIAAPTPSESHVSLKRLKDLLVDRGYQEVIAYSFIDEKLQKALFPSVLPITLLNPLSSDMSIMRHSLWMGLLQTALYNQARQTLSMRLFEVGQCFDGLLPDVRFEERVAGLICGQTAGFWQQTKPRPYDFCDIKGDVQALLSFHPEDTQYVATEHPVLAPGQAAAIMQAGHTIGVVGALHPKLLRELGLRGPVFLFELTRDALLQGCTLRFTEASKFPAIRRDLAIVVDSKLTAHDILEKVRALGGDILTHVEIFDVYQGEHLEKSKKSVALGLILQHSSRTLIDEEVNAAMQAVIDGLMQAFGAIVRE
jgi:phenylalanyl-tRNA synthetase beta chain